ncbi:aminotransferase [Litorimonas cladophorae]|uniref:Aminotransferase n=1 Tax=Litorimonas cladophorae TaxID=1220491 RepID=A0A918KPW1_9PROT|nr:aminotransferase class I/II-fold pyridoxal phosphate-dependent enzyme [Litorimonas cladophorae]GGX71315.1 aminotransferase [Litorimonas cladophorae]
MRNFALETYFSKWEFRATHHMTASDAQSLSIGELLDLADLPQDHLASLHLGYTETWGASDLRQAISATYETLSPENILCFAGAEEGVYTAMRVLLSAEDHAIVVVPNYQAAETVPLDICDVTGVALDPDNHWHLDLDDIHQAIRPNTKLISVCFPNNPTGHIIPHDDYETLINICREHGLYLFSDEVYRGVELDPSKRIMQAADAYEKGLSLNVMSKAYGLPGLRIGWIATQDKEVLQQLERYKHYLSICNSAPSERLAVIALSVREKLLDRTRALTRSNVRKLDAFFAEYPDIFDWQHPDGSCIGYPRFLGRGGVELFCERLVEEEGLLLLPASIYRSELMAAPTNRFRIGFGRDNMDAGLSAFRAFMDRNHNALRP